MQKSTTAVSHRSPLIALVKERYISNNEKVSFASASVLTGSAERTWLERGRRRKCTRETIVFSPVPFLFVIDINL